MKKNGLFYVSHEEGSDMKSRKWTSEEEFAVVMQGLKGEKSVSEICRENGLSQAIYYKWHDAFVEGGNKSYDHEVLRPCVGG